VEPTLEIHASLSRVVVVGILLKRRLEEAGQAQGADADYVARQIIRDALDAHGEPLTPRTGERVGRAGEFE
jgi:hypothetical protein